MNLGDAFTMPVPPRYDTPHLFFVISDPENNGGAYVIANVTTDYIRAGKECILDAGDHEWIKQESYVALRDARLIDTKLDLDSLVGNLVIMRKSLRKEILEKIVVAARGSKGLPPELKALL